MDGSRKRVYVLVKKKVYRLEFSEPLPVARLSEVRRLIRGARNLDRRDGLLRHMGAVLGVGVEVTRE